MTAELPSHLDRQRADSFGSRALAYDALRPRYPSELVGYLAAAPGIRVLDVGSGTGILARQLAEAGADVLAVEPDPRMARVARDHGITVEESTFEEWEDAGRRFDLVTFGQSFHWVDPERALPKVRTILAPGGALILTWNRVKPIRPTTEALTAINSTVFPGNRTDMVAGAERIRDQIVDAGFAISRHEFPETVEYTTDEYVGQLFTYSRLIILPPDEAATLRAALIEQIGPDGVTARNDALVLRCTPNRDYSAR